MQKFNQLLALTLASTTALVLQACATHPHAGAAVATNESAAARTIASGYVIQNYPILDAITSSGGKLSDETVSWMKKWKGMDLDDASQYRFNELSGSTSINLKLEKIDPTDPKGGKSRGSFVPRNGAGNPNTEIAYFNMAAILGYDRIMRPAARYELGPVASARLKSLINSATIKGSDRIENKGHILAGIASGNPLKGCVKAKKLDSNSALETMADGSIGPTGGPRGSHPVVAALQGGNSQPQAGASITLKAGYVGDAAELAHEYGMIMILDSLFQQWDRYSGGNIVISKDPTGKAHFYATDNGGADVSKTTGWVDRNLGWFSRYDRNVIAKLKELNAFLQDPSKGFLGYTDVNTFIVDLGLYFEIAPAEYGSRLSRNITLLLNRVAAMESKYGDNAYFQ